MNLFELVRDLYGIDRPQGCTEEEIAAVRERFGALPVVVMDVGGQYQCFYGGATEESYAALMEVMEGLGEPI